MYSSPCSPELYKFPMHWFRGEPLQVWKKYMYFSFWSSLTGRPGFSVGWETKSAVTWLGGGSWWRVVLGTAVLCFWWLSGGRQAEILGAGHICGGEKGGKPREWGKASGQPSAESMGGFQKGGIEGVSHKSEGKAEVFGGVNWLWMLIWVYLFL